MRSWRRCLDAAGIGGEAARADFSAAERYLRRREWAMWAVLRILVPPESQPHMVAATALARYTDDLCDRGPIAERRQRFDQWVVDVRTARETGSSGHALLRAHLDSVRLLRLSHEWLDSYVAG